MNVRVEAADKEEGKEKIEWLGTCINWNEEKHFLGEREL